MPGHLSPGVRDVFDDDLAEYARIHQWPSASGPDPTVNPADECRELLRLVVDKFDLPNLWLEINAGDCAWSLREDKAAAAYDDDVENNWRFVYEFYMDVGRALCETLAGKGLAGLNITTTIYEFQGTGAWLGREVTGKEVLGGKIGKVPTSHNLAERLSGSRYRPSEQAATTE